MDRHERRIILKEMKCIWEVIAFEDDEWWTACNAIRNVKQMFPQHTIFFANWWDRVAWWDQQVSAEEVLCEELGIEIVYGVGKSGKIQSSSNLLKQREKTTN